MLAYTVRRILLMIPTLFGIMLVSFVVVQFAPGGPVERDGSHGDHRHRQRPERDRLESAGGKGTEVCHTVNGSAMGWPRTVAAYLETHVGLLAPDGRLVVTVESATDHEASQTFQHIAAVPGVMSVSLVYHQFEPEGGPDSTAAAAASTGGS